MKNIVNIILFSSAFISVCAIAMVAQTSQLLHLINLSNWYYVFVIGGTVTSYNLHWYFTEFPGSLSGDHTRLAWTRKHHHLLLPLACAGLISALISFYYLKEHWLWIFIGSGLAFLYTAPKIPGKPGLFLRKIAIAKTIYLSLAWTYVTAILPVIISKETFTATTVYLCLHRYFFLYVLCILFDNRDKEEDLKQGIRSLITFFNNKGIAILFYTSAALSVFFAFLYGNNAGILLSIPLLLIAILYPTIKKSKNDYLYYFVVDGFMCLSFLFTCFQQP